MKIRQIEIRDFGTIYNKKLTFAPGLNVLYSEKEQERKAIHGFIEAMLFGNAGFPYAGVLWFESGGRNYRLTRNLHTEIPYAELRCEESGELLDADRLGESRWALGISEAICENAVWIAPLKGNTGAQIVRELQREMTGFQTTADCSLNPERAQQRLKMMRKGYQVQVERRKKAEQQEKEKILYKINILRKEMRELEEQKKQLEEQENVFRTNEENSEGALLDAKISNLEKRNRIQTAGMCATVIAALALVLFLGINLQAMVPAVFVAVIGIILFLTELNLEMRTVREMEKRKRMRTRRIVRQNKLEGGKSELEDALHEKNLELLNFTEELREMEEYAYLPLMEESETDALNLAMDMIEKLSGQIYERTGNRLIRTMSEILCEITAGQCKEVLVDEEYHISVDTSEGIVPIEKLRLITVGQIYLAMRLATGELLCTAESLPVIFDEMFCIFDQERVQNAVSWILRANRQVIVSTSKKKESEMILGTGIACNQIIL